MGKNQFLEQDLSIFDSSQIFHNTNATSRENAIAHSFHNEMFYNSKQTFFALFILFRSDFLDFFSIFMGCEWAYKALGLS